MKLLTWVTIGLMVGMGVALHAATTYQYEGKQITKGQAIRILATKPDAKVIRIDQVELNDEKGTLRVKK